MDLGAGQRGAGRWSVLESVLRVEVRTVRAWGQGTICIACGWPSVFPSTGTPDSTKEESQALLSHPRAVPEAP